MIAHGMSFFQQAPVQVRMLHHIFSDTEKLAFGLVTGQLLQHERRGPLMRPIIKTEKDFPLTGIPGISRIQPLPATRVRTSVLHTGLKFTASCRMERADRFGLSLRL